MWDILFALCLPVGAVIGLFCLARFVVAPFSGKSRAKLQRRPITHGVFALIALSLIVFGAFATFLQPDWVERRSQRKFVLNQIHATGGWNTFKKECESLLAESRTNGQGIQLDGDTWLRLSNRFEMISKLNPRNFQVVSPTNEPGFVVMTLFGKRSGVRKDSYYGLVYQQTANSDECLAGHLFHGAFPRRIVDAIFEVY